MSNEVKRWWIDLRPHSNARAQGYSTRHSAWSRPIVRFGVNAVCVMPVKDHERIVAELKAEIEKFKIIDRDFAWHYEECAGAVGDDEFCDCGLYKVRSEINAIEKGEA